MSCCTNLPDESGRLKASGNFSFVEVYKLVGDSHSYTYIDVGHILNPREHVTYEFLLEFVTDIVVEQARYLLLMDVYFKRKKKKENTWVLYHPFK